MVDREPVPWTSADLVERLNEAARTSTPLTIVNHNEGRPETKHVVQPIATSRRVLRARDLVSNRVRVFLLKQVEISDEFDVATAPLEPPTIPAVRPPSTREVLASLVDELQRLGWHVRRASDRLAVHLLHSDGKPLKIAAAFIARRPGPGDRSDAITSRRPWIVWAPGMPKARTFPTLAQAIALFMAQARSYAPATRSRRRPSRQSPR